MSVLNQIFRHAFVLSCALSLFARPSFCFHHPGNVKPEKIDRPETEQLIEKLGHQPELLRVEYLQYLLGHPEDLGANRFNTSKHYIWYRQHHQGIKFELIQEEPKPGMIVESTFIMHVDDLPLDLQKVESKFGKAPHKFFDQQACPTEEYAFAPNTVTSYTQKHNTFQVDRIAIHYKGDALPPPSALDMATASAQRKNEAMSHFQNKKYPASMTVLREHLGEHPEDLEAHLTLARAYRSNCQINEAIAQYRYTLQNAGADAAIRTACIADLQAMKVLPSAPADKEEQRHVVKLKHKGQRLRRGSLDARAPLENPLGIQPIDPTAIVPRSVKEPIQASSNAPPDATMTPDANVTAPGMTPPPPVTPVAEPF